MKWFELSLISVISMSIGVLGIKYLLSRGLKEQVLLFYLFLSAIVIAAGYIIYTKQTLKIEPVNIVLIFLLAAVFIIGNLFVIKAINQAPNPGYVSAILALQAVLVTLGGIAFFKSDLTAIKALGIIFAAVSLILIGMK